MPIINRIAGYHDEMTAWRRDIHAHPETAFEEHRTAGREIVIVSSSGAEVVEPIGAMLGADRVVATRMVTVDGRYTGEIEFYAYGENKAVAVRGRRLMVKNRFELTPLFESTVNADFRHIIGGGLKFEYHFSDILSFGVIGVASAS